jgi:hypothetical protein
MNFVLKKNKSIKIMEEIKLVKSEVDGKYYDLSGWMELVAESDGVEGLRHGLRESYMYLTQRVTPDVCAAGDFIDRQDFEDFQGHLKVLSDIHEMLEGVRVLA